MPKLPAPFVLALLVGAATAAASPRGLEFSTETSPEEDAVAVSFSVKGARGGVCYALVNPMGKGVAAACRGEEGWSLHGGKSWTFHGDGGLSVRFEEDPKISRIYPEEEGRIKSEMREGGWTEVDLEKVERAARTACEGKVSIPEDSDIRVTVTAEENHVLFGGRGESGESFSRAMVVIDRETGEVERVASP